MNLQINVKPSVRAFILAVFIFEVALRDRIMKKKLNKIYLYMQSMF